MSVDVIKIREEYAAWQSKVDGLKPEQQRAAIRYQCRTDLYYLLRYVLGRQDVEHPWLIERIREVQSEPDGYLDLWGRGHYKSTVITFGRTLMDILASHGADPLPEWNGKEPTFGIFSHTRPAAKAFLRQVKRELETNETLKALFPDILWADPEKQAPNWSEDSGIVLKRRSNPKESTVEAWGVVDGQPTGKHFDVLIDDDIVTLASVATPEMIGKTTEAWSLHLNLGTASPRHRIIGTRYHHADSYRTILERGTSKPRIRPATEDGTLTGKPVLLSAEQFERKAREMGPYVASAQLLLTPTADSRQKFSRDWVQRFDANKASRGRMNIAMLVDPANSKTRTSDFTGIAVIGRGQDENYYLLDAVRDRLSLRERVDLVIDLHRKWRPNKVGYEKYGMQTDIDYLKNVQAEVCYRFEVVELGGSLSKQDRINRLVPIFADGRFYLPETLRRTQYDGKVTDIAETLIEEELLAWPVPAHDDLLDAMSRIFDLDLPWPKARVREPPDRYSDESVRRYERRRHYAGATWQSG